MSVFALVLLISGANLYWGMPLHTGQVKKLSIMEPVDRFLLPEVSETMAAAAGFLDGYGVPSGNLRNAPAKSAYSVLSVLDALVNVWTSVTITLFALVFGLATGVKVLLASVMQFKILSVLGIALAIVMAPILSFLLLAVVLLSLAYQESTTAYLAIVFPVAILACVPAVVMFLQAIAFIRRWIVDLLSRQAAGLADGFSTLWSERRVHKVGVKYEEQLLETQSAMLKAEAADAAAANIPESPDEVEELEPAVAERWGNLLEEEDIESLIAEGDSIAEHDKAEDVSDKDVGQLFEERNTTAGEFVASVVDPQPDEAEPLIGDNEMTGPLETPKDIPATEASQDSFRFQSPAAEEHQPTVEHGEEPEVEDFTGTFGTLKDIPKKSAEAESFGFHAPATDDNESTEDRAGTVATKPATQAEQPPLDLDLTEEDAAVVAEVDEPPQQLELVEGDADDPDPPEDRPSGKNRDLPEKRFRGTLTHHDRKKT